MIAAQQPTDRAGDRMRLSPALNPCVRRRAGGSRLGRKKGAVIPTTPQPIRRPAKVAPPKPSKRS